MPGSESCGLSPWSDLRSSSEMSMPPRAGPREGCNPQATPARAKINSSMCLLTGEPADLSGKPLESAVDLRRVVQSAAPRFAARDLLSSAFQCCSIRRGGRHRRFAECSRRESRRISAWLRRHVRRERGCGVRTSSDASLFFWRLLLSALVRLERGSLASTPSTAAASRERSSRRYSRRLPRRVR